MNLNINPKSTVRTITNKIGKNQDITHNLILKDKIPQVEIMKNNIYKEDFLCTIPYVAQSGTESKITNKNQRTNTVMRKIDSTFPLERRMNGIVVNGGDLLHEIHVAKYKQNNLGKYKTCKTFDILNTSDCFFRQISLYSHGKRTKAYKEVVSKHTNSENQKTTIVEQFLRLENPFRQVNRRSGSFGHIKVVDENGDVLVNHYCGISTRVLPENEVLPPEIEYRLQKGENNEFML